MKITVYILNPYMQASLGILELSIKKQQLSKEQLM